MTRPAPVWLITTRPAGVTVLPVPAGPTSTSATRPEPAIPSTTAACDRPSGNRNSTSGVAAATSASHTGTVYARQLAKRGWNLVLVARRAQRLDDLAAELPRSRWRLSPQTSPSREDLDRVAKDDVALLVNNPGINGYGPFGDVDPGTASSESAG